jgi:16S rRNA (guanine527-N7)-methyltransferase
MLELGLQPEESQARRLLNYLDLVHSWNQSHNLTGTRDRREMLTLHLLDCLAIAQHVYGNRVLDVGSGAGLPGFPLAISRPELDVISIDSRRKKTEFQIYAAHVLELENIEIVCDRVETYRPEQNFDTLACRAFSSLENFVAGARRLCKPTGRMLAMKGSCPERELEDLKGEDVTVLDVVPLTVPGLSAERCLVIMAPE